MRSTWRWSRSCSACWSPGRTACARPASPARADAGPAHARRSLPGRGGDRVRLVARQPLADAAAGAAGRAVRALGRAATSGTTGGSCGCAIGACVATVVLVYLELPLRAGSVPGARWSTAGRRPGTASGTSSWANSSGASVVDAVRATCPASSASDRSDGRPVRPAGDPAPGRLRGDGPAPAAYALLTGSAVLITWLLRRVLRERRHRSVLPRPGPDGLDLARDPCRGGGRVGSARHGSSDEPAPGERVGAAVDRSSRRSSRWASLAPGLAVLARRDSPSVDMRHDDSRGALGRRCPCRDGARGGRRQLVELLDAAMVCAARGRPPPGPRHHRRPDPPGPGTWRLHRRDRRTPGQRAGLRDPRRPDERSRCSPSGTSSSRMDGRSTRGRWPASSGAGNAAVVTAAVTRCPSCRTSSPPTTRRPTWRASSRRRSPPCPGSPTRSRSSRSTTARATRRRRSPTALADGHPDVVRLVHHPINLGYGAALRSGFARRALRADRLHRRRPPVQGRGPRPARPSGWPSADAPDVVVGLPDQARRPARSGRSTPAPTGWPTGSSSACGSRDVDCACKLVPPRGARGPPGRVGRRVLLGGAADQAPGGRSARGRGRACPHYPRTAGSATGAKPQVVLRAVRDFWRLRLRMWVEPRARAPPRASPILGD